MKKNIGIFCFLVLGAGNLSAMRTEADAKNQEAAVVSFGEFVELTRQLTRHAERVAFNFLDRMHPRADREVAARICKDSIQEETNRTVWKAALESMSDKDFVKAVKTLEEEARQKIDDKILNTAKRAEAAVALYAETVREGVDKLIAERCAVEISVEKKEEKVAAKPSPETPLEVVAAPKTSVSDQNSESETVAATVNAQA